MKRKSFDITVKQRTDTGGTIVINTADLDRDNERVLPSGAIVDHYLDNPIVFVNHDYRNVEAIAGVTKDLRISDVIEADFELREPAHSTDMQHTTRLLWQTGVLKTASVGFIPINWVDNKDGSRDYTRWELLEWSLTGIPSNRFAQARSGWAAVAPLAKSIADCRQEAVIGKSYAGEDGRQLAAALDELAKMLPSIAARLS